MQYFRKLIVVERWRLLILGLALLMVAAFYANFVLSCMICVVKIINHSSTENSRGVMYTETFDLVEYKHQTWRSRAMARLILGEEPSRDFLENNRRSKHLAAVNPRVFDYIINNSSLCTTSGELSYVLSVYTSPNHFEDRMLLRNTYGRVNLFSKFQSRTVFFLGAVRDPKLQESILAESQKYGDIVQANFIDSYHNLSYKGLTQLRWFNKFCSNAKYLVKVDDDLYFDIFQIVKIVKQIAPIPRFILGTLFSAGPIQRNFGWKWGVKTEELPRQRCFPTYYQGWLYIIPNTIFSDLYEISMTTPVFHIDDVYITGLLMGQVQGIKYIHFNGKAPEGYFMPTHPRLAQECEAACKLPLWCRHLANLREEDEALIGSEELAVVLSNIDCEKAVFR